MQLKEKIYRIRKSKDGKVLAENFVYLSLLQVTGYIFPLITLPYLARVIGVDSFGKIAFASAIIVWVQTITDWGFNYTATRDVAKNRENKEKVSDIFSNVLWARLLLMILSLVLLITTIFTIPYFRENRTIILITFLIVPGQIMFPDWFFQAMERMKYITILNLISKSLFTLLIFIFIKEKSDFILQPLFNTLGFLVSGIISMYIIVIRWKIKIKQPTLNSILITIKNSTDVFFNNFVPNLFNSFSIILLGIFGTPTSNGKFDAGTKFVDTSQQFMNIIARSFFPYLSRKIDKHNFYVKINIYISLCLSILLFLFSPLIIKIFFTPEFNDSINILRILSITIFFMSVRNAYGTHFMLIMGYQRKMWTITLWCSILGFILAYPLVYFLDFWGAAINIMLIKGLLTITFVIQAIKIKKKLKLT